MPQQGLQNNGLAQPNELINNQQGFGSLNQNPNSGQPCPLLYTAEACAEMGFLPRDTPTTPNTSGVMTGGSGPFISESCVINCGEPADGEDDSDNLPEEEEETENDNDCNTSKEDLKKVFPDTEGDILEKIAEHINTHGKDFGIDTKEKLQHFLAQAGHESNNFDAFEENLNYRWRKLGQPGYWKNFFNPLITPNADPNKANPNDYKLSENSNFVNVEKFANLVYNDAKRKAGYKLGNTSNGDGYKYRGRGIFQLTGKSNYQDFTSFYQQNYDANTSFISNPELLISDKEIAVISALWFYKKRVLDKITVDGNTTVKIVTKKVNGRYNGLDHRKELHEEIKEKDIDCL